ncbi:MAG: NUDIX domain-containing protein [Rhizomicrobium sp.]
MISSPDRTIRVAAALLCASDGRTLLVRKRGTTAFMQAGGKIEPGEAPVAALLRELREELGLMLAPSQARHLGRFHAPAAHEPGWTVDADVFRIDIPVSVQPAAEIEEVTWITPGAACTLALAPLTRDHVLPLLDVR